MIINKLQDKIVGLDGFFQNMAGSLRKNTKLKLFHFLMLDNNSGNFISKYSTDGSTIKFRKKELHYWNNYADESVFCPKTIIGRYGFLSKIFLKIHWKIRLRGASAIMPVYRDSEIICLVLFFDRFADDWLRRHPYSINIMQEKISYYLETILLYNQTLERLIKEYYSSNKQLVYSAKPIPEESTPRRISRKTEVS